MSLLLLLSPELLDKPRDLLVQPARLNPALEPQGDRRAIDWRVAASCDLHNRAVVLGENPVESSPFMIWHVTNHNSISQGGRDFSCAPLVSKHIMGTMKTVILVSMLALLAVVAGAETKGNLDFAIYRGAGSLVLPQYAAGPQSDLLWVSAQDRTGAATHLVFTAYCTGLPSETRMVQVWPHQPTTTVFERARTQPCNVSVDAVVAGERQTFSVPGE